jgi:hypothetical protein
MDPMSHVYCMWHDLPEGISWLILAQCYTIIGSWFRLIDRLSIVLHPSRKPLTHMETSPLLEKGCKVKAYTRRSGHFFMVSHLLWHVSSVFTVSSERLPPLSRLLRQSWYVNGKIGIDCSFAKCSILLNDLTEVSCCGIHWYVKFTLLRSWARSTHVGRNDSVLEKNSGWKTTNVKASLNVFVWTKKWEPAVQNFGKTSYTCLELKYRGPGFNRLTDLLAITLSTANQIFPPEVNTAKYFLSSFLQ